MPTGSLRLSTPEPYHARRRQAGRGLISCIVSFVTLCDVDYLRQAVRQRIETEGLRPFSVRTGIPVGQLRSLVQGRAARYTTLASIASVMGLQLYIGPARRGNAAGPGLPPEIARALDLPSDASVADAVGMIDKDLLASKMREGMGVVRELADRAAVAAELIPRLAAGAFSTTRMVPFVREVRLRADTGEVEFEESAELSIAVAEKVLPSWARAGRLTCVRVVGRSMEPTVRDGDLVVLDQDRPAPLDAQLFVLRTGEGVVVRRLRRAGGCWNLINDNPAHLSRRMADRDRIVGRVAWCGPQGAARA